MWTGLFWCVSKFFGPGWQLDAGEKQELGDATADVAEHDLPEPVVAALDTFARPLRLITSLGTVVGVRMDAAKAYADTKTFQNEAATPAAEKTPASPPIDPLGRAAAQPAAPSPAAPRRPSTDAGPPPPDPIAAVQERHLVAVPADPFTISALS